MPDDISISLGDDDSFKLDDGDMFLTDQISLEDLKSQQSIDDLEIN